MRIFTFLLLLWSAAACHAQRWEIGLFRASQIKSVVLKPRLQPSKVLLRPGLQLYPDSSQFIHLEAENGQVRIKLAGRNWGLYREIRCIAKAGGVHNLKPVQPDFPDWTYAGTLVIKAKQNELHIVNWVEERDYLAGVLKGETGRGKASSFYEAMAVVARTYAYYYKGRHRKEGFDLCDQHHCQVYKGFSPYNAWFDAVQRSEGLVIHTSEGQFAEAVFHANCGGQTSDAAWVWKNSIPNCTPVNDPFCFVGKGSRWNISIDKRSFLNKTQLSESDWEKALQMQDSGTAMCYGGERFASIQFGGKNQNPVQWRSRLNLKSAWFDVHMDSDSVYFSGNGFGHGVGMCQEGAMEMAVQGCGMEEILQFYFRGIRLVYLPDRRKDQGFNRY